MDVRTWYEVEALMADLTAHRHEMMGATEDEVEQRIRDLYPDTAIVMVREREGKQTREEKR